MTREENPSRTERRETSEERRETYVKDPIQKKFVSSDSYDSNEKKKADWARREDRVIVERRYAERLREEHAWKVFFFSGRDLRHLLAKRRGLRKV